MTQIAATYAQALYDLAKDENLTEEILAQLQALQESISAEPDFVRLLSTPGLSKEERCGILDASFRDKVHTYVLSFMKILVEKGYMRHFADCCKAYKTLYNADHGITPKQIVKAITSALPTSKEEGAKIVPMGAEGSKPRVYVEPESAAFVADPIVRSMSKEELEKSIANTTALMKQAAKDLDFMQAAQYRDEIIRLQKELEEKG